MVKDDLTKERSQDTKYRIGIDLKSDSERQTAAWKLDTDHGSPLQNRQSTTWMTTKHAS
jgi:hypothetical protein